MNFIHLDNAAKHLERVIEVAEKRLLKETGRIPDSDEILAEPDVQAAITKMRAIGLALAEGRRAWRIQQMFARADWEAEMERPQ